MRREKKSTITITFGDAGENHVGMQQLGKKAERGFTKSDLVGLQELFREDYETELVDLESFLPENLRCAETAGASILIVRDALQCFELDHDVTFQELKNLKWDSKFWSQKHGGVVNKTARWNLCFGDFSQDPDYEAKKGRVYDFKDVPALEKIRSDLALVLGDRVSKFIAEGNYYYDASKCGIGFHGDTERRMVIAVRFGEAMTLVYQWHHWGTPVGPKITRQIRGGDLYVMSEIAVGTNWKTRKVPTLRHAAGCAKYTEKKE